MIIEVPLRVQASSQVAEVEPVPGTRPPGSGAVSGGENRSLKGVGRSALVYGVGILLTRLISLLLLPVYTRFLGTEDYGVMALIEMTLDVISIVAGAQLAQGVFRYYHKSDDPDEKLAVVSTALLSLGASYLMVALLVFALAPLVSTFLFDGPERVTLIRVAACGLLAQSLLIVPLAYARVRDRARIFVAANLAKALLGALLNIYFLAVLGLGVMSIFISAAVAGALVAGAMLTWTFREVGFGFSRAAIRDLLRFGVPMIGMQFATFTFTFGDRFILKAFSGEGAVGLYSMAYSFAFLMTAVGFAPIEQVWGPRRFAVARSEGRDAPLNDIFRWVSMLLITLALGMSLFIGDVLRILTTPAFHPAGQLVHFILLAFVIHGWTALQDLGILIKERTEYLMAINWAAAALALFSFWILIPLMGPLGASLGTLLAALARWGLTYSVSQRLWRVEYQWPPVLRTLLLAIPFALVGVLLGAPPLWFALLVRVALFLLFLISLWWSGIFAQWEKDWLAGRLLAILPRGWGFIGRARHVVG